MGHAGQCFLRYAHRNASCCTQLPVGQVSVGAMTQAESHTLESHGSRWAAALSASRAKEYLRCPLQYRLHVVDQVREDPTLATAAGTLVHSVLEHLFDVPAEQRLEEYAQELVEPLWEKQRVSDARLDTLIEGPDGTRNFLAGVRTVVSQYFRVEDPRWLEPVGREKLVEVCSADGIRLRGFIDRVDCSPRGDLRVVDYKTGRAPAPRFIDDALFQMRFYALLLKLTDRLPTRTQLLYLKSGRVLTLDPTPDDIVDFSSYLTTIWEDIESDARRGYFEPRRNPLCNWCSMQALCPLFDGKTPEMDQQRLEWLLTTRQAPISPQSDRA